MRILAALIAGILIGWFARHLTIDESSDRSDRRTGAVSDNRPERARPVTKKKRDAADPAPDTQDPRAAPRDGEAGLPDTGVEEGEEADPIADMIKSQSAMWKGMVAMQVKPKIEALLMQGIDLDAGTEARIQEAMLKEAEQQMDRVIDMMLGKGDLDPDVFSYFLGLPADLSPELEKELATFLDDAEIATVRAEVKKSHEKQLDDLADVQIKMMSVPNLRDDQNDRLREVFRRRNFMKEQFVGFAELTRNRKVLKAVVEGKVDIAKHMKQNFEPMRRRVRDILDDTQFVKYEAYEQQQIAQAQMGLKMMSAMLKPKEK